MRPVHLHVQGFMPFRQSQEVDFSGLDLFAIVGPTGSGKSALLDAMTFALYGSTPRLGSTGMDALISQSEQGCSVMLEFEVRGERYKVARSRGRKASQNQVTLEQWNPEGPGRWISAGSNKASETNTRIAQAVGLEYAAFTRAVLLPQGEFSAFLKGKNTDRQKLLGDLMNLQEISEMAAHARERSKGLGDTLKGLHKRLDGEYADISPEQLDLWAREYEANERRSEELGERRNELNIALQRLRELGQLTEGRRRAADALSSHDARMGAVRQGAERAQAARRVAGVLPLIDAQERSEAAVQKAAGNLGLQERTHAQALEQLASAAGALETAEREYEQLPTLEAQAEALKEAEALAARLKRAGGRPDSTHAQPLPWDEEAHAQAQKAAEQQKKNVLERSQLELQRSVLARQQVEYATEQALQTKELAELERFKQEGIETRRRRDETEARVRQMQERAGVQGFRHLLHVGEPCPLCEQVVATLPAEHTSELDAQREALGRLDATLDVLRERCNELIVNTRARARNLTGRAEKFREDEEFLSAREADLRTSEAGIVGDPGDTVARYLAGLALRVRRGGKDPASELRRVQDNIRRIRQTVEQARGTQASAQAAAAVAQSNLTNARTQWQEREHERQQARAGLETGLSALGITPAQARAAALPEADISQLETAARQHEERRAALAADLADLTRKLGTQVFDPQQLSATDRELSSLDAELKNNQERGGQLREMRRAGQERLERKAALEAEAGQIAAQLDTWKTLSSSLGVSEFQQYLLQEVESRLLSGAGQLLQEISDGRYRLGLEDGDYVVQDLWNAGDTRAVRTLSGGETFLASLALAIALSDYLAGNQVLGALFLDEGFGTLDPQALEAVAGALENLRTGGRMVGVITHIESLSERLPSHLLVSKSAAGSSVQRLEG
ncbi:SMC family ATPase [Deinococcus sp. KNUC1210]|uniref:AAA family ATPase n=1 Tax=Deinococcus sp. KNUC1210 TaxID=2917691 RepID=UPI001EF04FDE|nr:SMC family ATPase [Deinococcus sp. KNUC1210]ULH15846.1 SMC family ATPase [Deinococcus sp. KNUC1210]